ncbi:MAG: OsmC family protein [Armatimonadota bacterium]
MTEIRTRWINGMQFLSISSGGHPLVIDVSPDGGGRGEGIGAMELMLHALAGCTGVDVVSILEKKRQPLKGLEIRVKGERRKEYPRVYTYIEVEYIFKGKGLDPKAVEQAIKLSQNKYCSVEATLAAFAQIQTSYRIIEEDE